MYQLTMQDSSYRDYPIQYSTSPSTRIEEIDIADMWNNLLFNLEQEQPKTSFYLSLSIPIYSNTNSDFIRTAFL